MVTFWIPGINPIVPTFYQPTQHTEGKQDITFFLLQTTEVRKLQSVKNIATGETSQAITSFHFFDNFNFHH